MAHKALITGVTGQDGSYLAEFLLDKGYAVYGMVRRGSLPGTARIEHLIGQPDFELCEGDLCDGTSLHRLIGVIKPDEVYNLAAQSHVQVSFEIPEYTADATGVAVIRLLEAIRESGLDCRFYQASSSELFGQVAEVPQRETTPFRPRSPYAAAKALAFYMTKNYREAYRQFAVNGILFNHESPRRGETFVTRKISLAAASIAQGMAEELRLGNLDASRDWGFAGDYVEAMWMMMRHDEPKDYVIATGETHSVREFCEVAFARVGIELRWQGEGVEERGVDQDGRELVVTDPRFFRPAEVDLLLGDASLARRELGWSPRVGFAELVAMMVDADLDRVRRRRAQAQPTADSR